MNRKRLMVIVFSAIVLGAGVWLAAGANLFADSGKDENSAPAAKLRRVQVTHPTPVSDERDINFPGRAQASREATLFFRVSGPLVEVTVKPGDSVQTGQVLMRIDPRDYKRRIANINAGIKSTEAQLLKMKNGARMEDIKILEQDILVAKAQVKLAEKEYHRHHNLLDEHAVSEQLYDKAENIYLTAKAKLASLQQQLTRDKKGARKEDLLATQARLDGLRTELDIAQDQLADTELKAPFDGFITRQLLENYEMAKAGAPVLAIHDISMVEIPVDVPENQVARLLNSPSENGFRARFFTLENEQFPAKLHEWNGQADPATGTYRFVFRVKQPEGGMILPGMTAQLTLNQKNGDIHLKCLLVPAESLVKTKGNQGTVWVVDPVRKTAEAREVVLAENYTQDGAVIREGLSTKDLVVAKGAKFVRSGETLEFQNPDFSSPRHSKNEEGVAS